MVRPSPAAANLSPSIIREMSRRKGPTTLDLTLGQPGRDPDPDILERALEAHARGPQGYTENAGLLALREAIARHHGRAGPEEVIVTVGSEQALYLALSSTVSPGDEVLIPEPGYPAYPGIPRLLGAEAVTYPITREGGLVPSVEDIADRVGPKTRAVIWNAPSNPFGSIPDRAATEAMARLAEEKDLVLVSDEIYRDLTYGGADFVGPADLSSSALLVGGLSKSCALTGFRLGYLCGPAELIAKATLVHQLMVTCAPRLSQLMAIEVFSDPSRLKAHLPDYAEARAALEGARDALPVPEALSLGEGAFYAIVDVSAYLGSGSTLDLALELLAKEDVAVVPGLAFGASGDWFWRLSYAAGAASASEGLRRIGRFLRAREG